MTRNQRWLAHPGGEQVNANEIVACTNTLIILILNAVAAVRVKVKTVPALQEAVDTRPEAELVIHLTGPDIHLAAVATRQRVLDILPAVVVLHRAVDESLPLKAKAANHEEKEHLEQKAKGSNIRKPHAALPHPGKRIDLHAKSI